MDEPTKPESTPTEREQLLAKLLFATARTLYRASLMGVPCQAFDDLKYKVNLPRTGDWALEVSHFSVRGAAAEPPLDFTRFGRIVRITDDRTTGRVVLLEAIDGKLHRWANADFIRVFEDPFTEPSDAARLAWVAEAEKRHGLPSLNVSAVIK
ncbi:MAG: hypothetical protein HUU21_03645 [Polyangiaceae bacterium]|nr:hypothetical protein [Polyangiaceae bacterium]NUQ72626.1 hypothetical protein [Polyangiaceae bacterium]